MAAENGDEQPRLRVINQDATAEEVAALVAVFSAIGAAAVEPRKKVRPAWGAPARSVRQSHPHGDGAWRISGLPR